MFTGWLVEANIINSSSDHWLVGDPKLIPIDILAKVQDVRELYKTSDFGKWLGATKNAFLQIIPVRVLLA